jgi:microcystin-dependent protein
MADSTPYIGTIMLFAGNFAPRGFALCQGQLLAIAQNTALFSLLGTTYGGDGKVTFGLPDLRGRAPVGAGQGAGLTPVSLGQVAGKAAVTVLQSQLPMHTHFINANGSASDGSTPSPGAVLAPFGDSVTPLTAYATAAANTTMSSQSLQMAGGSQPVSVMNPFLGINFIIAVQGIYPSRN